LQSETDDIGGDENPPDELWLEARDFRGKVLDTTRVRR
jgi:hypothetical protein